MGQEIKARVTPADVIASPAGFCAWWQKREPRNMDNRIRQAAVDAGLITAGGGLIYLTTKGRLHKSKAFVGKLPPRARKLIAMLERELAREQEHKNARA